MQEETKKIIEFAKPVIPQNWNLCSDFSDIVHGFPMLNIHLWAERRHKDHKDYENFGEAERIRLWPPADDCFFTEVRLNLSMIDLFFGTGNYFETLIHELAHIAVDRYYIRCCKRADRGFYFINLYREPMHGPLFTKAWVSFIKRVEKVYGKDFTNDWDTPEFFQTS